MNTLLEIAHIMALSDGNVSKEEERLIRDLLDQIAYEAGENDHNQRLESSTRSLKELVALLTSDQDRCLAVRVAFLVVALSRQPRDRHKINADEYVFVKNSFRNSASPRRILAESKPQPCKS